MPKVEKSQVLNFLWLNLDLPAKPDPEDGSIRKPLPEEYIENVRAAGKRHPQAEIDLWVDSKRLTEKQMAYLKAVTEIDRPNVHIKDLRTIPAYNNEKLYNEGETNENWRVAWSGKIWLQVDAAKILISLQGNFDQSFFADLDHAHLDIESKEVQKMLGRHGLMIGSAFEGGASIENQLWGFEPRQRVFFEQYYERAVQSAYNGFNGFGDLCSMVSGFKDGDHPVPEHEICLPIGSKGLAHAIQPGHEWSGGAKAAKTETKLSACWRWLTGRKKADDHSSGFAVIPADKLAAIFSAADARKSVTPEKVPVPAAAAGTMKQSVQGGKPTV